MPAQIEAKPVKDMCEYYAACLEKAMKDRHGGYWKIEINHEKKSIFGRGLKPLSS